MTILASVTRVPPSADDHSRVPLRALPGQKKAMEYVNANYIDGYDKPRAYIGTQVSRQAEIIARKCGVCYLSILKIHEK